MLPPGKVRMFQFLYSKASQTVLHVKNMYLVKEVMSQSNTVALKQPFLFKLQVSF